MFVLLTKRYSDDQQNNEVGRARGTNRKRGVQFWWGILKKRDHLEGNGGDGSAISSWMLTKQGGGGEEDWIDLDRDTDKS